MSVSPTAISLNKRFFNLIPTDDTWSGGDNGNVIVPLVEPL